MSDRVRYLVSAACVGAAIGSLVYLFAVMGITWPGPQRTVLVIAAAGLITIAKQVARAIGEKKRPYGLIVVGLMVGASFAFGVAKGAIATAANVTLSPRELPGFSVSLPDGDGKQILAYIEGHVVMKNIGGTGGNLEVQWEPGKLFEDDEIGVITSALAQSTGAHFIGSPVHGTTKHGEKTLALHAEGENGSLVVTVIECGHRRVTLMTMGDSEMGTLHQRILDSFACHPDPKSDAELDAMPWTVDLGASWKKLESPEGQAEYLDASAGNMLIIRGLAEVPKRDDLKAFMGPMMAAAKMDVTLDEWVDDRFPLTGTIENHKLAGFIMPITCGTGGAVVMAFSMDPAKVDALHDLVKTGHCANSAVLMAPKR